LLALLGVEIEGAGHEFGVSLGPVHPAGTIIPEGDFTDVLPASDAIDDPMVVTTFGVPAAA
jgi:hypothetical protein